MSLDNIVLSQQAKEQLIKVKRYTGLEHWNELCRWAFCMSMSEPSMPPRHRIPADSSVEMTWKVFGGANASAYRAVLQERCIRDGVSLDEQSVSEYFRQHLHRGIGYLAGGKEIRSIRDLVRRAMNGREAQQGADPPASDGAEQDGVL